MTILKKRYHFRYPFRICDHMCNNRCCLMKWTRMKLGFSGITIILLMYISMSPFGNNLEMEKLSHCSMRDIVTNTTTSSIVCDEDCGKFRQRLIHYDQVKAAIYYLVRAVSISKLIGSIQSFDKHFNNKFKYPIIIFHDNDFTVEHIHKMKHATQSELFFQRVAFSVPDFVTAPIPDVICERDVGYRHMCRFHAKGVYEQPILACLDYALRLDDDSYILADIQYDIFRFMSDKGYLYGYIRIDRDNPSCVENLWSTVNQYADTHSLLTPYYHNWQEPQIFYNNFEISSTKLWLSQRYQEYINMIDATGGIYYHRWGDAPIKTLAVTLFSREGSTYRFRDIEYRHQNYHWQPSLLDYIVTLLNSFTLYGQDI